MNQLQMMAARLRARLTALEQPHLERTDGLRELLELQGPEGRRETWRGLLDKHTYRIWSDLSGLLRQVEWSVYVAPTAGAENPHLRPPHGWFGSRVAWSGTFPRAAYDALTSTPPTAYASSGLR